MICQRSWGEGGWSFTKDEKEDKIQEKETEERKMWIKEKSKNKFSAFWKFSVGISFSDELLRYY